MARLARGARPLDGAADAGFLRRCDARRHPCRSCRPQLGGHRNIMAEARARRCPGELGGHISGVPSSDRKADRPMAPREAILNVPVIAPDQRRPLGNITASLAMLDDFPEFPPVIGLIDVSGDIETLLAELTEIFARIYLANAHDVLTTIVFIHGVTSLTAFGGIIPTFAKPPPVRRCVTPGSRVARFTPALAREQWQRTSSRTRRTPRH